MEEDSGVKAPVTRLRRRLSVEQSEESKSPAPGTPTKGRRGRKKPELELIEENSTAKPNPEKLKTVAKDLAEEEKPITPSRRSARIRSNTSIVSETTVVDSPRAKRAARRLSQVGSDTEGPATPVRQTRRTRKDSASSIDKVDTQVPVKQNTIPEPITEENEALSQHQSEANESSKSTRRSPRLQEKKGRKSKASESPDKVAEVNESKNNIDLETKDNATDSESMNQANITNNVTVQSPVKKGERISIGSAALLENISAKPSKKVSNLNKSTSAVNQLSIESKRSRTKSCTITTLSTTAHDNMFYSDSESAKKRRTSNNRTPLKQLNNSGSNKSLNKSMNKENSFTETMKSESAQEEKTVHGNYNNADIQNIFTKNPSSDMQVTITFEDSDSNPERINRAEDDQCVPEVDNIKEHSYKLDKLSDTKKDDSISADNGANNDTCEPMDVDETIPDHLLIDHSGILKDKSMQSPQKSKRKSSIAQDLDANESQNKSNIISGFPVLSDQKEVSSSEANISKQNTSIQSSKESKRKSSISRSFNESETQNKSTLVLSHLKDISESETNKTLKSPQKLNDKRLSNSSTVLNVTQENIITNKNLSLCYSTSTPLQQKGNRGINVNTSNIKSPNESKLRVNKSRGSDSDSDSSDSNDPKGKLSKSMKEKSHSSESSDESMQDKSNLMDDEAEDAGEDYESGDSQDEEEREEALANEIREKGETLTSEEELSDDSDYERDSFVVSSAEEDNELLEGTDDDLSMSDNELNMSKKSKEKYNERKLKEQKRASREMFESRHQINKSNTGKKKIVKPLDSSSESESDDEVKKPSKGKGRNILDSSGDITTRNEKNKPKKNTLPSTSSSESDEEVSKPIKTKNKQRLDSTQDNNVSIESNKQTCKRNKTPSQSICNETLIDNNEKEMSINTSQIANELDPLCQSIKIEPKTPLKENNISLAFIDAQNNTNVSIKEGDNLDPLASTVANDDEDSSMSSDNERIVHDYESILQGLNKSNKNKIKSVDTSLNLEKKTKKKGKDPIVDELNLTQVKVKKSKNKKASTDTEITTETKLAQSDNESASSESALMNLLFSEESNNCNDIGGSDYIPLKRVAGKTDIHNQSGTDKQVINESIKTPKDKKNRKLSATENKEIVTEVQSNTESAKKRNKKLSTSINDALATAEKDMNQSMNAPASGKKTRKISNPDTQDETDAAELSFNKSILKTPSSEKKKKKPVDDKPEDTSVAELSINQSISKTPSSVKKKKKSISETNEDANAADLSVNKSITKTPSSSKKKKKSLDNNPSEDSVIPELNVSLNKTSSAKKKQKKMSESSQNEAEITPIIATPESSKKAQKNNTQNIGDPDGDSKELSKAQKRKRKISAMASEEETDSTESGTIKSKKQKRMELHSYNEKEINNTDLSKGNKSKKRKEREDDDHENVTTKAVKESSMKKVQVSRLPTSLLEQLDDNPKRQEPKRKKSKITATTDFVVEETKIRKNKPSMYLEESIYLHEDEKELKKQKAKNVKPKVLPFVPTASTSISGYTTTFKVNVIPRDTKFVAQSNNVANFKSDYLYNKKIKRNKTYETYKRSMNVKCSKF